MALALCGGIGAATSFAQSEPEKRVEGNGPSQSEEKTFPLAHFLGDFASRDVANTLCLACTQQNGSPMSRLSDFDISTEKRLLGVIANQAVFEIHTTFAGKTGRGARLISGEDPPASDPSAIVWKSIVVQNVQKLYREVYFLQATGEYAEPLRWSGIYKIDEESILAVNDPMSGNGGYCSDGYWQISASGAQPIDFSQVDLAMAKAAPKGSAVVQTRCWALNIATMTIASPAQEPNSCHVCGYTARVTAHFHFEGNVAIPNQVKADPIDSQ
jgi:hypothetical protein